MNAYAQVDDSHVDHCLQHSQTTNVLKSTTVASVFGIVMISELNSEYCGACLSTGNLQLHR